VRSRPLRPVALIALVALTTAGQAGVEHPSIGVCTRKEEFAKRQATLA
jgi:hypothetical protein